MRRARRWPTERLHWGRPQPAGPRVGLPPAGSVGLPAACFRKHSFLSRVLLLFCVVLFGGSLAGNRPQAAAGRAPKLSPPKLEDLVHSKAWSPSTVSTSVGAKVSLKDAVVLSRTLWLQENRQGERFASSELLVRGKNYALEKPGVTIVSPGHSGLASLTRRGGAPRGRGEQARRGRAGDSEGAFTVWPPGRRTPGGEAGHGAHTAAVLPGGSLAGQPKTMGRAATAVPGAIQGFREVTPALSAVPGGRWTE